MRLRRKKKVVLALGAGGARGLAHIGVIRALNEAGIPIDAIAGVSFGAIIGALYSLYLDIDVVEKKLHEYMDSPLFQETSRNMSLPQSDRALGFFEKIQATVQKGYFFSRALSRQSVVTPETFVLHMKELVGDQDFRDLKIPYRCSSVDLITGHPIIFSEGPLCTALQASCATPGFFPPVSLHGMLLVDGGVAEMMPVFLAKTFRPDYIIGVDVTREIEPIIEEQDLHHSLDVVFRSYDITRDFMNIYIDREADCVIRPDIGSCHWSDFKFFDLYVERGFIAARTKIPEIRKRVFLFGR
ncbi:MAG: NTE family protein RssA [Deltaproteobacteria bacterium ADurb.BinA179]|jgi:NTE family protein|nr:MAG: NTE family protein RssA [Deltaproteobacteria bacterium ADurb.BinA179]HNU74138.1 patatin-like phospholipase family protein [Deltaproteobacteria bacterium]HOD70904.1 patatin-like phospholipase family protein [Deltaproteobacteria bacterium]HOE72194.1 patatin-like phospholipase family protein [Deltaproteobacteria bacterium]HPL86838.1 patatin-like phospholipase family protein [Deltaproteobacteria bacterium]